MYKYAYNIIFMNFIYSGLLHYNIQSTISPLADWWELAITKLFSIRILAEAISLIFAAVPSIVIPCKVILTPVYL